MKVTKDLPVEIAVIDKEPPRRLHGEFDALHRLALSSLPGQLLRLKQNPCFVLRARSLLLDDERLASPKRMKAVTRSKMWAQPLRILRLG